jgi:hypothetical protein
MHPGFEQSTLMILRIALILSACIVAIALSGWTYGSASYESGPKYYFAASGSDSNACSQAGPCQTIAKANGLAYRPGTSLLFNGTDTFAGCATFTTSNTAAFLTIGSYGPGNATINANCSGARQPIIDVKGVSHVKVQNLTLKGNQGGAECGVTIENPTSTPVTDVTLQDLDISGIYTVPSSSYCADVWIVGYPGTGGIDHVNVLDVTCHGATISSPDEGCINGFPNGTNGVGTGVNLTNFHFSGITVYYLGGKAAQGTGILVNGVNGAVVDHIIAHDLAWNDTACGGAYGIETYNSNNVTIHDFEVYNVHPKAFGGCDDGGLDIDIGTTNVLVYNGYTHNNWGPGYAFYNKGLSGGSWGPTTVYNVISYGDSYGKTDHSEGAIAIGGASGGVGTLNIVNSTIWESVSGPDALSMLNSTPAAGIVANNVFAVAGGNMISFAGLCPSGMSFKNNDYYVISGSFRVWNACGSSPTSLAGWQAIVPGGETGAVQTNPSFVATLGSTCDWDPTSGTGPSPCPTAGQQKALQGLGRDLSSYLPGMTTDYWGNPYPNGSRGGWNIGADNANWAAPAIAIISPTNDAAVSGSNVAISTTGRNLHSTVVQTDGTTVTSPWDSTTVADGSHTVSANGCNAGSVCQTARNQVWVENYAPVISSISATSDFSAGYINIVVTWTTNVPTTSQIDYGTTTGYGATQTAADNTLTHTLTIAPSGGTLYNYQIKATNALGSSGVSGNQTVTTLMRPH